MANRLQKKLHELETEFANIIRLPMDPTSSNPRHQAAFDDIRKRFIFLKNILTREIASQSSSSENADELREIGGRLTALEAAFRGWNELRMSVCSDCTQALLQRVDTRESEKGEEDEVRESSSDISDSEKDEAVGKELAEEVMRGKRRKSYGGVFGCGMIAGAVCIEILFYISYNYFNENQYLLIPPT